ncbi:MAG: hypothetical protein CVU06_16525, partial [Bacteroidetes bacterium HGW-Bacteroidetes-22]
PLRKRNSLNLHKHEAGGQINQKILYQNKKTVSYEKINTLCCNILSHLCAPHGGSTKFYCMAERIGDSKW